MSTASIPLCVLAASGFFLPARAFGQDAGAPKIQQAPPATEPVVIPAPPAPPLPAPPDMKPAPPTTPPAMPAAPSPPPDIASPSQAQPAYAPPAYPSPAYAPPHPPKPGYAPAGWPGYYPYPPRRPPGAETHDGGYIRLQLGISWTGISARASGNVAEYNGGGASLAAAFGFSVNPRLILYLELLDAGAANAEVKVNGAGARRTTLDTGIVGIGPGAATYFGHNLFLAGTILIATVQIKGSNGDVLDESRTGLALEALFGKEWWVSDNWGLGLSGQLILGKMKGKDADMTLFEIPSWSATSLSLLFSATYN